MSRGRILVIDDKANMLKLIARMLGGEYEIETANDPVQGIEIFRAGDFDLVVTDVRMPGMNGMEVLELVKSYKPDTQVIVMTAYGEISQAVDAVKMGAYEYITKPFDPPGILRKTIERALEHARVVEQAQPSADRKVETQTRFRGIIGESPAMQRVYRLVERAMRSDTTVLIEGDSGTGKELFARAIHAGSVRSEKRFIAVNCAAIPTHLIESELFGHMKGAFTGAVQDKKGLFESANGGTIFLDEIGELELGVQAKINRVLQEHEIRPVGSTTDMVVDARVIAATNVNLRQAVSDGRFREDLYYRLNVFPIRIPPLRDRREDIPLLAHYFLHIITQEYSRNIEGFELEALELLEGYHWPGNVRELRNVIERAVILCDSRRISPVDLVEYLKRQTSAAAMPIDINQSFQVAMQEFETSLISSALERSGGNMALAARLLRIKRTTLVYRVNRLNL